ncbi:unnamed protein product, partial [Ectocarpus sp. 8 AP-2014]
MSIRSKFYQITDGSKYHKAAAMQLSHVLFTKGRSSRLHTEALGPCRPVRGTVTRPWEESRGGRQQAAGNSVERWLDLRAR